MNLDYQILIIGGGPAGLAAALTVGRLDRSALVCDDGRPRNAASSHANNVPAFDGVNPSVWRERARQDLNKYASIEYRACTVTSVEKIQGGFRAILSTGVTVGAHKLILATGIADKMLPYPGFKELWGKAIFHCVFCHGFEVRNRKLGFLVSSEFSLRQLFLVKSLTSNFTVFTNGSTFLEEDNRLRLKRGNVTIHDEPIETIVFEGEELQAIVLGNGGRVDIDFLFAPSLLPFDQKSPIGDDLRCEKTALGLYKVDDAGETSVEGVFACGDNSNLRQSVLSASASGSMAAIGALSSLLKER